MEGWLVRDSQGTLCCVLVLCVVPGPEVIKLEYNLKLKMKRNDWLLADTRGRDLECKLHFLSLYITHIFRTYIVYR